MTTSIRKGRNSRRSIMTFAIRTETHPEAAGLDPTVYVLEGPSCRAEVWPALGFNCYHWRQTRAGTALDLLYADPNLFRGGRPTRSGIPILFPFPNRIRDGRFTWAGKEYQLPLNDPAGKNAIHGFACRHPWRVVGQGADAAGAWLTGAFRASQDAPDCLSLWPADYEIQVTFRLADGQLRIEAEVHNPDQQPLPFGLGYHPYFRVPFTGSGSADDCLVTVPARYMWVLDDSLPTGERRPVEPFCDLNHPRRYGELHLDTVLTDLPTPSGDQMAEHGAVQGAPGETLSIWWPSQFRDAVVFTPPHRQAFCIEPYTCTTDAINLQQRGIDAGLLVLPPGGRWAAAVELRA
jgi:aldose 1-epimerase